jgi:hypothetical protein
MYPHLCRIDNGCNNYRLQVGRGRILPQGRACAPRGYLPRAGLFETPWTSIKSVETSRGLVTSAWDGSDKNGKREVPHGDARDSGPIHPLRKTLFEASVSPHDFQPSAEYAALAMVHLIW